VPERSVVSRLQVATHYSFKLLLIRQSQFVIYHSCFIGHHTKCKSDNWHTSFVIVCPVSFSVPLVT